MGEAVCLVARTALVAGAGVALGAVDGLGQLDGEMAFAHALGARDQDGMRQSIGSQPRRNLLFDALLPGDSFE